MTALWIYLAPGTWNSLQPGKQINQTQQARTRHSAARRMMVLECFPI